MSRPTDTGDTGSSSMDRTLTRRAFLRGLAGAGAAIPLATLLAACGGDSGSDSSTGSGSANPTSAAAGSTAPASSGSPAGSSGTRSVAHAMGTTDVPANPQRVVVLDMGEMDMALALGIQPIGAALYTADQEFASYLQGRIGEYTRVGTVDEPDLEAIASLNPDLIISNKLRHEDRYDTLSRIAPTVFAESLGVDWKASFEVVARALGQEARHQEVMTEYGDRIDAFQQAMGDRLAETHVTIVRSFPDHIRLYMKASFIGTIIEDSGLPRPASQNKDIFMEEISAERIRDLAADVIFTLYWNRSQGEQLSSLMQNPLWDRLAAVQAGQVFEMSDEVWGTGLGPLAAMQVVDDLQRVLVDGDVDASIWSEETATAAFPVTLTHKFGSTTIEAAPERVVALGLTDQDALLALNVVPIATREWYGQRPGAIFPWAEDELGDADLPEVLAYELDFERIAALQPDVIIGLYAGLTQEEYDTLSRIAPTVAQPAEYVDWGIPWQELTVTVGKILGRQQEAEALVADVEALFVAARDAHPELAGAPAVVASPYGLPENYWVYGSQDTRGRILTALGFEIPAVFDELAGAEFGATVSIEQLNLIADLDALIWVSDEAALKDVALYQSLPVVQEGRVLYYGEDDPVYDALNFGSVLSLPFALERFVPHLAAAVDGDPATEATS
jgi:iron complex transport system substrate-binding protein